MKLCELRELCGEKSLIIKKMDRKGFTLIELMVTLAIVGILAGLAIPGVVGWLPNYRIKRAARDLYSTMQSTKLSAIKANDDWALVFDATIGRYLICSNKGADGSWSNTADNTIMSVINLPDYGSGITYGHGISATNATSGGGAFPADEISYNSNVLVYNLRGTGSAGYVYIQNNQNTCYAVGTGSSGAVILRKWYPTGWL